jgi:VIT1/CCC1 family predicted Fe2+/Mn2+ transporter
VRRVTRVLAYTWAAPTTCLFGLPAGLLTLATGGKVQHRQGALEFHGGFSRWFGEKVGFGAMTLGHVIIGRDPECLDSCRNHEQAHVRQVERWGAAFVPAYFVASYLAWQRGEHFYLDNWFERDARRACGESRRGTEIMPTRTPEQAHIERHFLASEFVRDIVIGMSDGLTVPFALAAGLSGAVANTWIVVTAGLAEIAAGSIAMGLGGYLAARSDAEHYASEKKREEQEVIDVPHIERAEVADLLLGYGLTPDTVEPILDAFEANPEAWVDFMMRFELGLEEPDPRRAVRSAATIAGAYIAGGLIPLAPYMIVSQSSIAMVWSVVVTLIALLIFGYVKGHFTGTKPWRSALQTVLIGGIAAAAAFLIARAFNPQ